VPEGANSTLRAGAEAQESRLPWIWPRAGGAERQRLGEPWYGSSMARNSGNRPSLRRGRTPRKVAGEKPVRIYATVCGRSGPALLQEQGAGTPGGRPGVKGARRPDCSRVGCAPTRGPRLREGRSRGPDPRAAAALAAGELARRVWAAGGIAQRSRRGNVDDEQSRPNHARATDFASTGCRAECNISIRRCWALSQFKRFR
jgi:hypothetical protein